MACLYITLQYYASLTRLIQYKKSYIFELLLPVLTTLCQY